MLKQPWDPSTARPAQEPKRARSTELSVYDGRTLIGLLRERGKRRVEAFTITGNQRRRVGAFKTRREAMRAIPRASDHQGHQPREAVK